MIEMIKKIFSRRNNVEEPEMPFNVSQASPETILYLKDMGILEFREDGIHVVDI